MLILGFPESLKQAQLLADQLHLPLAAVDIHHFPDGESLVTLPTELPQTVIFFRSLHDPNAKLLELYLAIATARDLGCERVVLVAPYLCYMRQDKAFKPGQGVSQKIIGDLLSQFVDDLITVDPHLHRTANLADALPHCRSHRVSAAPLLGSYISTLSRDGILVGPDEESRQWVEDVAAACNLDYVLASKERRGDREVRVTLPAGNFSGRPVFLVDDMITTGNTMAEAATQLLARGATSVTAVCSHALFAVHAQEAMADAGIQKIISSNSVPHSSNQIDLSPVLAEALGKLL